MVRKTASSHRKDNTKNDNGMTMSSRPGDTVGGARGILPNAGSDVPLSILQKRRTTSTDTARYENEMTTSSRARNIAVGGRAAFSNAYSDVPMSIPQQMSTSNAHHNDDHSHHQHDHTQRQLKCDHRDAHREDVQKHRVALQQKTHPNHRGRRQRSAWAWD